MSTELPLERFINFLRHVDPVSTYKIVQLNGGLVNFTVRAIKISDSTATGQFPGQSSLILKYAPPYVSSVGEAAPFSDFRQVVEARALRILEARLPHDSSVYVPTVLHHDEQHHILVITDLGDDLTTIDTWLGMEAQPTEDQVASVSQRLGKFLARLHQLEIQESTFESLENPEIATLIKRDVIDRVNGTMDTFRVEKDEGQQLVAMMEAQLDEDPEGGVLSVGDLWTGSILISPHGESVAIVDWEFAGKGRPLQDMAQFGSYFCNPSHNRREEIFSQELFTSYRQQMLSIKAGWVESRKDIRSAWILLGREMLYRAGNLSENDKDWLILASNTYERQDGDFQGMIWRTNSS